MQAPASACRRLVGGLAACSNSADGVATPLLRDDAVLPRHHAPKCPHVEFTTDQPLRKSILATPAKLQPHTHDTLIRTHTKHNTLGGRYGPWQHWQAARERQQRGERISAGGRCEQNRAAVLKKVGRCLNKNSQAHQKVASRLPRLPWSTPKSQDRGSAMTGNGATCSSRASEA